MYLAPVLTFEYCRNLCLPTTSSFEYLICRQESDTICNSFLLQDGKIEAEVKLTGILSLGALQPGESRKYGTTIAPGLYAPVHQHFFVARMDMAVDCKPGEAFNQVFCAMISYLILKFCLIIILQSFFTISMGTRFQLSKFWAFKTLDV